MNPRVLAIAVLASTAVILLAFIAALYFFYLALRRQAALAAAHLAYEQELRTVETEVAEHTLAGVAAELHDGVGGQLTLLRIQLETLGLRDAELHRALAPASSTLTETVAAVRHLSHGLNPDVLAATGLAAMIARECARLRATGRLHVSCSAEAEPQLHPDVALVAFRIFQESVTNALKHAEATSLHVTVRAQPFQLLVTDNGRGFDASVVSAGSGAGLLTMQRRAALAGLRCRANSTIGSGTTIRLEEPAV